MYLVHLGLRHPEAVDLPSETGTWIRCAAGPGDAVEHVTVHLPSWGDPVLGVFLIADCLEDAERQAAEVCRRVLATRGELAGWVVGSAQVPLLRAQPDL